ncbi:MAG: hypothetical protein GAK30_00208 [Paracidovorax wautersii]|uniref:DUF3014 domain-containing protein n=1 Tax=Paracidovorax wautersii TaxID=1177982 RepID=A0A7V8JRT5_9BURK|nr:MAG: hypothetical protein GAK30_00208 [Paracidovorax wautersii]
MTTDPKQASPTRQATPGRGTRIALFVVILVLPVAALLWMGLGRSPKSADALSDGEVTRRSSPSQAVEYALPQAVHAITALTLPDGAVVSAQPNLPRDRDQTDVYIFAMVTGLVGRDAQQQFFSVEDFSRRVARTAANLPRRYLPSAFWPVRPTEGRFLTDTQDGKTVIAAANAERYAPLVQVLAGLDATKVVAAYVKAYPLFQKAYASLGHNYASYYLNDAVIAAIDDLLRTPDVQGPIAVVLPAADDPKANASRPWVTYRYADPALESLSVAQKTLLRMGPAHAAALKAKLREVRALLVAGRPTTD